MVYLTFIKLLLETISFNPPNNGMCQTVSFRILIGLLLFDVTDVRRNCCSNERCRRERKEKKKRNRGTLIESTALER